MQTICSEVVGLITVVPYRDDGKRELRTNFAFSSQIWYSDKTEKLSSVVKHGNFEFRN